MTNIEDGSRAHAAHGSGDVRANSGLAFANLTHLPHLPHLPSNNSCGYEEDPTSRNAPGERATVDQGLVISELRAENERLRAYEEEAERQFSEHADEWGRITARLAAVEALCDAAQPLVLSGGPFGSVALGGAVLSAARVRAALAVAPQPQPAATCEHGRTERHYCQAPPGWIGTTTCPGPQS